MMTLIVMISKLVMVIMIRKMIVTIMIRINMITITTVAVVVDVLIIVRCCC